MAKSVLLPEANIAFRVYNNNNSFLGLATLELPDIQYMTETLNGAGLLGEIETPVIGLTQSMTVKMTMTSANHIVFDTMDWTESRLYECYSSEQVGNTTDAKRKEVSYRINFAGRVKGHTLGSLELGKKHENELEFEVFRLEVFWDNQEKLVIDKMNFIHRVNGTDLMAGTRNNLGLSV